MKVKYLGITFDRKLLCNGHINNTGSKTSARISEFYVLLRYHNNLSPVIKRQLIVYAICI
jgi:hypothetical protein